jgi:tRNA (guanine-N7-)-methyltransferase
MVELIPDSYFAPLDLPKIFNRVAPLEVDLGCGDGSFLTDLAERSPRRDFIGIERLFGRARSACSKAARRKLTNVRVLRIENSYAVEYLFPRNSVAVFHLLFPDPWPKRRHHRRRVVTVEQIRRRTSAAGFDELADNHWDSMPVTTFEENFRSQNTPVYRLSLRKVS